MHRLLWITACGSFLVSFFLGSLLFSSSATAATSGATEQLWLISTREAPANGCCQGIAAPEAFSYQQWDDDCQWVTTDLSAFLATYDPTIPTAIFVHGNRADQQEARKMGLQVYQQLKCSAGERPFRLVIWSWPSDRVVCGMLSDARIKACRSDAESFYLATVLDRLSSPSSIALVGYSFGARVVSGALELLAGGTVAGQALDPQALKNSHSLHARVVLIAAAEDSDWLAAGHRYGQALSQAESALIVRNQRDPALKYYGLIYHLHGPHALGSTGACELSAQELAKISLLDVGGEVGRHHDWKVYFSSPLLLAQLPYYALNLKDGNVTCEN